MDMSLAVESAIVLITPDDCRGAGRVGGGCRWAEVTGAGATTGGRAGWTKLFEAEVTTASASAVSVIRSRRRARFEELLVAFEASVDSADDQQSVSSTAGAPRRRAR